MAGKCPPLAPLCLARQLKASHGFAGPVQMKTTGPAAGNGYEIVLQAFNWESCKEPWYRKLLGQAKEIADSGFTAVWLPPPTDSVSSQVRAPQTGDMGGFGADLVGGARV